MLAYHSFETGQADGTTVTTGNSGTGGIAATSVTIGTGAATTYTTTRPRGALALRCLTTGTAAQSAFNWATAVIGSHATIHFRCTVRRVAGAAGLSFLRMRGGGNQLMRLTFTATGQVQLRNAANTTLATSTAGQGASDWWLIRGTFTPGATGSLTVYVHFDRTNPVPDETLSVPNGAFGTVNVDEVNWGIVANLANAEVIIDDALATEVAIPGPPAATVVVPTAMQAADTGGRAGAYERAGASDLEIADVAARDMALSREGISGVLVADDAARAVTVERSSPSSASFADTVTRALQFARNAASAIISVDFAEITRGQSRTAASSITIGDAAEIARSLTRAVVSAVSLADTATASRKLPRKAVSGLTLADVATVSRNLVRAVVTGSTYADAAEITFVPFVPTARPLARGVPVLMGTPGASVRRSPGAAIMPTPGTTIR